MASGSKRVKGASDEDDWYPQLNFLSTIDSCDYVLTSKEYGDDVATVSTSTSIDYSNDCIVNFGCSNHMIGDVKTF